MIKRLVAGLLAAAVGIMQLMPLPAVTVYADDGGAVISASKVKGRQGETVSVELSVSNNPGINAFGIQVSYDTDALECTGIIYGDSLKNVAAPLEMLPADMKASPFRVGWAGGDKTARFNEDDVFLTLKFSIMETAANGDYTIALSQKTPGETARYDDNSEVSSVPVTYENGTVTVSDEKLEYTGAVPDAPSVSDIGADSFAVWVLQGNEYTYSESPITDFSECEWYTEAEVSQLLPNTKYYVYQRVAETYTTYASPASEAAEATTAKYNISDIIGSVSIGTDGTVGTALMPVITYKDGFDESSSGRVSYNWLSADTSLSTADNYVITADDVNSSRVIYLTVSAENCSGVISSDPVTAVSNALVDPELTGINVNGEGIADFSKEKLDYEYSVSYENWLGEPGKTYTVEALSNSHSSVTVSDSDFSLSTGDPDTAAVKDITVTVTGNSGEKTVYTVRFIVEKCPHTDRTENVSVEPSCTELGKKEIKCTLCNKILGTEDIPAAGHDFDEGTIITQPDCENDGVRTYVCKNCGIERTEPVSAVGHFWSTAVTDATCTEDGVTVTYCMVCGAKDSEIIIPAFGHSFGEWIKTDETTYTRVCKICVTSESKTVSDTSHDHIFHGRTEVIKTPTCQNTGLQNVYCSVDGCIEYVTEELNKTPHTPGEEVIVDPTCTESGSSTISCAECGTVLSATEIPAAGHSFTNYIDTATCMLPGAMEAQCDNGCGAVDSSVTTPAKGHSYGSDWLSDAAGHWHLCTVCGDISAVMSHTENSGAENSGIVTLPPTSTSTGIKTYSCTDCGYVTRTEIIPVEATPVDPTPVNPKPTHPGSTNPSSGSAAAKAETAPAVTAAEDISLTFNSDLSDSVNPGVRVRTNRRFFGHSAEIRITNTSDSEAAGKRALARLGNDDLIFYAFDISIYNADDGSKMQLARNGYITFEIPVPQSMEATAASIEVYHIPGGVPEHIDSELKTGEDGSMKVVFTATEFSPYMFTAAASESEDISAGAGMTASAAADDFTPTVSNDIMLPENRLPRIICPGRKRRYRILRKRRLDDSV